MLPSRWIARIGLLGGPLIFASSTAILFGAYEQLDPIAGVLAFPVFAWEMSRATYRVREGFREPADAAGRSPPAPIAGLYLGALSGRGGGGVAGAARTEAPRPDARGAAGALFDGG